MDCDCLDVVGVADPYFCLVVQKFVDKQKLLAP